MNRLASRAASFREIAVLVTVLFALLPLAVPSVLRADVFTAFGDYNNLTFEVNGNGVSLLPEVFDVNTETGAKSNIQTVSGPGPVQLYSMDRDTSASRTLWGTHGYSRKSGYSHQLVTINETTGKVTVVATLNDSYGSQITCPAIAFVPGQGGDTLYAIIRTSGNDFKGSRPADGFHLVTVDLSTGAVSYTGIPMSGNSNGNGHGLAYDHDLDILVHFFYDYSCKTSGDGSVIEVLDRTGGAAERVYSDAPFGEGAYPLPSRFHGVTDIGEGQFLAYDNDNNELYLITISSYDEAVSSSSSEKGGNKTLTQWYYTSDQQESPIEYTSRALDVTLNTPGALFGLGDESELQAFDELGDPLYETEIFVTGQPIHFQSLATNPTTGAVYGLAGNKLKATQGAILNPTKILNGRGSLGYLQVIDRFAGPEIAFPDYGLELFDVEYRQRNGGLYSIESIAFDDRGTLWGIDHHGNLVTINTRTGAVVKTPNFEGHPSLSYNTKQLDYNPDDGLFYVVYHGSSGLIGSSVQVATINPANGTFSQIMTEGDFPPYGTNPMSLVYGGRGNLFFNVNLNDSMLNPGITPKPRTLPGANFWSIDVRGNFVHRAGNVADMNIYALTQLAGTPPCPDVSVGLVPRRLVGDDIYNATGARQTVIIRGRVRSLRGRCFFKLENDGSVPGSFRVRGRGGRPSDSVTFINGGKNVTGAIRRGHLVDLPGGGMESFRVTFSRRAGTRFTSLIWLRASVTGKTDAGKARVALRKILPKPKKPIKPTDLF